MTLRQWAIGTLVGGATLLVAGYAIFGVILANFFYPTLVEYFGTSPDSSTVGTVDISLWTVVLGQLTWGGLLTLLLGWRKVSTVGGGLKTGAVVGFLFVLGLDLTLHGLTNIYDIISDPIIAAILFGAAGGATSAVVRS